ncbi:hypothetical protein LCGC14_2119130, partial [marine sediment metagenome]
FKAGIRRGATPLEAGISARNVTLDFAKAGTTAHALNRYIAFFNANIRGWDTMITNFKENPVRTALKVFGGITLPSILLYYANRDDERWKELPQWQKDLFWIVLTEDRIIRIPKPFELGIIFGSGPERFLEWLDERDPKLMKDMMLNIAEAGSPGWLPTAILPIIENLTNHSFFRDRPLVPPSRQQMPPELQYTRYTGETTKKVGEMLKVSPAKVENLINGWTGGLGRYATGVLDRVLKETGISPNIPEPSDTLADKPVLKAFVVRNPFGSAGKSVNEFYELLEEYGEGEKFLKEMLSLNEQKRFDDFKSKHPELLFFSDFGKDIAYSASARYLRKVARELSALRKKEDEIFKSKDFTSAEKRRLIDEIDKVRFEVARRALKLFPAEEPLVLQKVLSDADNRLGEVLGDVPPLSREKPKIYDTKKLNTEYSRDLEAVEPEDLEGKNVPGTVFSWFEKEDSEKVQVTKPNMAIYKINADPEKGDTFEDYVEQWKEIREVTDPAVSIFADMVTKYNVPAIFQGLNIEMAREGFDAKFGAGYASGTIIVGKSNDPHAFAHELAHYAHERLLSESDKGGFQESLKAFIRQPAENVPDSEWERYKQAYNMSRVKGSSAEGLTKEIGWEIYAELYAFSDGDVQKIPETFRSFFTSLIDPKAQRMTSRELQSWVEGK